MLADPNAEAWLGGRFPPELLGSPPGSQSPSPRLCPRAAPSLEKMSQPWLPAIQERRQKGKGSCLWSLYCASVSLGLFGSLPSARLLVTGEPRSRACDEGQACLGVCLCERSQYYLHFTGLVTAEY